MLIVARGHQHAGQFALGQARGHANDILLDQLAALGDQPGHTTGSVHRPTTERADDQLAGERPLARRRLENERTGVGDTLGIAREQIEYG